MKHLMKKLSTIAIVCVGMITTVSAQPPCLVDVCRQLEFRSSGGFPPPEFINCPIEICITQSWPCDGGFSTITCSNPFTYGETGNICWKEACVEDAPGSGPCEPIATTIMIRRISTGETETISNPSQVQTFMNILNGGPGYLQFNFSLDCNGQPFSNWLRIQGGAFPFFYFDFIP